MIKRIIKFIVLAFLISSVGGVLLYKFVPVYVTPLMIIRCAQQAWNGEDMRLKHTWVSADEISPHLANAVIASEDNLFASHSGFDWNAIKLAYEEGKAGKRQRGGSTISQQTAKNVFLCPYGGWVRKGLEAYFTVLIELCWSKERIMEIYLNSIEMGDGIYGAEAVAQSHFNRAAKDLTRTQASIIAATLPNPLRYNSAAPSSYITKRARTIRNLMRNLPAFPSQQ